jgi:hypothetical protein
MAEAASATPATGAASCRSSSVALLRSALTRDLDLPA